MVDASTFDYDVYIFYQEYLIILFVACSCYCCILWNLIDALNAIAALYKLLCCVPCNIQMMMLDLSKPF